MIHRIELPIDNDRFIDNLCLSYRHDFGLMDDEQKNALRFECKLWLRSLVNNAEPVTDLAIIRDFCEMQNKTMRDSMTPDKGEHYMATMNFAITRYQHVINLSNALLSNESSTTL